jgi:hypothetical protein
MPIVIRPDMGAPLSQGDILRKVTFALANKSGELVADSKATYALVMSRNCNAERDGVVTVAPILPFPVDLKALKEARSDGPSLDKMRRILAGVRDGGHYSDNFYVGPLEDDGNKRFAAQLGTLCSIQVPTETIEREKWLHDHRIWRLQEEFLHDLHTRMFLTFARLGFDDYAWFADVDLSIMITEGEAEVASIQAEVSAAEQAVQAREANNQEVAEAARKTVESKRKALQKAQDALKPYLEERKRRNA